MAMNSLKDIVQRCHERHEKPLRQRKTVVTPAMYTKDHPHQYTVYCAHRYPAMLHASRLGASTYLFHAYGTRPLARSGSRRF